MRAGDHDTRGRVRGGGAGLAQSARSLDHASMAENKESTWQRWSHYWLNRSGDTNQWGPFDDDERLPCGETDWNTVRTTLRTVSLLTFLASEEQPDWAAWWLSSLASEFDGSVADYESWLRDSAVSYRDAQNLLHAIKMHTFARNRIWDAPLSPTAAWLSLTVFVHANDRARSLLDALSPATRMRHEGKPVLLALPIDD